MTISYLEGLGYEFIVESSIGQFVRDTQRSTVLHARVMLDNSEIKRGTVIWHIDDEEFDPITFTEGATGFNNWELELTLDQTKTTWNIYFEWQDIQGAS